MILLDVEMPDMTGVDVGRIMLEEDPDARILLTSGHTDQPVRDNLEKGTRFAGFLQTPYNIAALRGARADAMAGSADAS